MPPNAEVPTPRRLAAAAAVTSGTATPAKRPFSDRVRDGTFQLIF